ncbi:hypothetical protein NGG61_13245 [Enterococcus casseliflavus]|uniref:hypothetical protein n=1 Tax=Enterococcus casseliflavus TaxID=37734 RepID=UPI002DB6F578|nr:hypothetical protein [Enterococcus casseliflavus]MEB8400887.1 hypothetical protein [Enterococcus casseliflavus]
MIKITTTIEADTTEEYKEAVKSLHDQVVKEAQKAPEYKFNDTEEKKPLSSMVSISGTEQSAHGQPAVPTNASPANPVPMTPPAAAPVAPTPAAPVQPATTQAPPTASTAPVQTAPAATAPVSAAPQYTFEQLAAAAAPLSDAGKQAQLIEAINTFGVASLTDLPKEQYGAFATKLRELGAKI